MPIALSRDRLAVVAAAVAVAVAVAVFAARAPVAYAALDDEPAVVAARGQQYVQTRLFFGTERPDAQDDSSLAGNLAI